MKTAIGGLLSTGIETAPLLSAKVKDVSRDQFTVKLAEMLSGGDSRPVTQNAKAISIGAEGQVKPSADSIVDSRPQGSMEFSSEDVESSSQDEEGLREGGISPGNAQIESANSTGMPVSDAVESSATLVRPPSGPKIQVDVLPSSATTKEIDIGGTQPPLPIDPQKGEDKGTRFEKSDLKSHRSNGESKTAKKVAGKERQIDAQTAVQTSLSTELTVGGAHATSIVVPTAERADLKEGNGGVAAPDHVQEKPLKTTSVAASSKPLSSGELKESNKSAPVSNTAQEQSESSTRKERVAIERLSGQSNFDKKETANTSTVAHRPDQTVVQSNGTMQLQTASTATHRGSATGDLDVSERRTATELAANGTTTANQPHILKATASTLEVGVADGTHGWVKVRAEMSSDGRVNASLSSSSLTGQQMLRHELPSLTTFLRSENVQVGSLTIQTPTSASERSSFDGDGINGSGQGAQPHEGGQSGEQRGANVPDLPAKGVDRVFSEADMGAGAGEDWMYTTGGSWLNVMA